MTEMTPHTRPVNTGKMSIGRSTESSNYTALSDKKSSLRTSNQSKLSVQIVMTN
jgi:hypothetical protein